jgi:hypothetical protein
MLNNFALCKMPPEQRDNQGCADQGLEKVMIHSHTSASPMTGERWRIRRRSSTQGEEIYDIYKPSSLHRTEDAHPDPSPDVAWTKSNKRVGRTISALSRVSVASNGSVMRCKR